MVIKHKHLKKSKVLIKAMLTTESNAKPFLYPSNISTNMFTIPVFE